MDVRNVPWNLVKRAYHLFREEFFTTSMPDDMDFEVHASLEEVRQVLGQNHFTNSWELSYHYKDEDMNMRRPEYIEDEYNWYQTHVRGWDDGDIVKLNVHRELEPTEYPDEHLNNENLTKKEAIQNTKEILDEAGLEYTR